MKSMVVIGFTFTSLLGMFNSMLGYHTNSLIDFIFIVKDLMVV